MYCTRRGPLVFRLENNGGVSVYRLNLVATTCALLFAAVALAQNTVTVSVPELTAGPGDEILVPVQITGLEDEIVSGEIRVEFDPAVLEGLDSVRRGSLTADQRWLTGDLVVTTDPALHLFKFVFAAATGFAEDGDIVFLAFKVNENATGTVTDLVLTRASLNEGTPVAELVSGSLRVVGEIEADFVARPLQGEVPLEVQFVDRSFGSVETYAWDFGDGSTSSEQNPQHSYTEPDSYTVSLTVSGAAGSHTKTKDDYISALPDSSPPVIVEGPRATSIKANSAAIRWLTNERSDSFVEYSTREDFPDSETVRVDDLVKAHAVELVGLQANTKYFYRVNSTDAAGNTSRFKRGFFRTKSGADNKPPVITWGPAAEEITQEGATIVWKTNEESTSIVEYLAATGDDDDFDGALRVVVDALVENHLVELTGLQTNTRYRYRVRSVDAAGNESRYKRGRFRTLLTVDTQPPVIELGPVAIGRTHQSATIKWITNEQVSALVNYGTSTDYDLAASRDERRRVNLIRLTNLELSTLYHYQVVSTDAAGNIHESGDFEFTTRSEPDLAFPRIVVRPFVLGRFTDRLIVRFETDESCLAIVEYGVGDGDDDDDDEYEFIAEGGEAGRLHTVVLPNLNPNTRYRFRVGVTDLSGNGPVLSQRVRGRTHSSATDALPSILQGPIVANRESDRAIIAWRTNLPTDGFVDYGLDATYGNTAGSAELALDHEVVLSDLVVGTTYHFRVVSTDPTENEVASDNQTLTTRATPDILLPFFTRGPAALGVTDHSGLITWTTNEPTDALVEYGPDLNYGESVFVEEFSTGQRINIAGLEPEMTYHFRASVKDRAGNGPTSSDDISFTTLAAADTRSPAIIAGPGARDVKQDEVTIVWRTDEPADSFVDFGENTSYNNTTGSAELTRDHQVTLTNLSAGNEFHYRVRSTDLAGNTSSTDPNGNERWSRPQSVRTLQQPDTKAPFIIRGPLIIAGNKGAVISFTTDERCIARLAYGTAQTLGTPDEEVVFETEPTSQHSIRIANLNKRTRYIFRLTCLDAAGNELVVGSRRRAGKIVPVAGADDFSGALEFSTEEDDDTESPVITAGPTIISRTADTAIIEWTTDEPADSYVDFGVDSLTEHVGDAEYTQEHSIVLTGLDPSTPYTYQVRSTDFVSNAPVTSQSLGFTTLAEPDLEPPSLAGDPGLAFVDDTQAIIEWTTDEPASVELLYGAGNTRDLVFFSSEFTSEHTAYLVGLEPNTDYSYLIRLSDPSSNGPTESAVLTTTAAAADLTPPVLSGIAPGEVSDVQAIIEWTTDEPANSFAFYGAGAELDLSAGDSELFTEHRVVLTNLSPATTYSFAVESLDPAGNTSGQSQAQSFTTASGPDEDAPNALAGIEVLIGLETAIITWPSAPEADLAGYTLYRQIRSGPFAAVITGLADSTYTDAGLSFGTSYTYYVTATDLAGNESEPSNELGGTPSSRNVPSPISPVGSELSGSTVTLQVSNAEPGQLGGVLTYTFHVSTSELFDDIVARVSGVEQGTGTTSWSFDKELEPEVEYWWRTRASDGTFDGPWSFPSFFLGPESASANTGDFNGDGSVSFDDFFLFADQFGLGEGDTGYDSLYDLDGSLRIDFGDFFTFADVFGTVYAASRSVAQSVPAELGILASSRLVGDEVLVELRTREASAWRGLGLLLRYDPEALTWLGEEIRRPDLLRAAPGGLYVQIAMGDDEVALFAHRGRAADFSGAGSVAHLHFRLERAATELALELSAAAVQTPDGVAHLEAPQRLVVRLLPDRYVLRPNFPNPFNPETTLRFELPHSVPVRLEVFDALGQKVRTLVAEHLPSGAHQILWRGVDERGQQVSTGVYFYRLQAGDYTQIRRMLLLK